MIVKLSAMVSRLGRSPNQKRAIRTELSSRDRPQSLPIATSFPRWLWISLSSFLCIGLWVGNVRGAIATPLASIPDGSSINPEITVSLERGAQIFQNNCTVCHISGKNLIVPDKNLSLEALHRYGKDSIAAIMKQVTYGKGVMPAFGEGFSEEEITNVATYVLRQAQENWNPDSTSTLSARKTPTRFRY